jgi:hypothetical protein
MRPDEGPQGVPAAHQVGLKILDGSMSAFLLGIYAIANWAIH